MIFHHTNSSNPRCEKKHRVLSLCSQPRKKNSLPDQRPRPDLRQADVRDPFVHPVNVLRTLEKKDASKAPPDLPFKICLYKKSFLKNFKKFDEIGACDCAGRRLVNVSLPEVIESTLYCYIQHFKRKEWTA